MVLWLEAAGAVIGIINGVNTMTSPGGALGPGVSQTGSTAATGSANVQANAAAISNANPDMNATTVNQFAQAGYTPADITAMQQAGVTPADMTSIGGNLSQLASGQSPSTLSLGQAAQNYLSSPSGQALINTAYNNAGAAYQTNAAGQIGAIQATGAQQAANIGSTAALQAARVQSGAAAQAGQTAATAATNAAGQAVAGEQNVIGTAQNTLSAQQQLQQPYQTAGTQALQTLSAGLAPGGQFNKPFSMADAQNMPAYNFALTQGEQAINNASAAGGTQLSSANLQSLGSFAAGTAAQYEQQAFNQWLAQNNLSLGALQNMVATGQISTGQLNTALQNAGISVEAAQKAIGQAEAAGTLGAGQATSAAQLSAAKAEASGITGAAGFQGLGVSGVTSAQAGALQAQAGIAQQAAAANAGNANTLIPGGVGGALNAIGNLYTNITTPSATSSAPSTNDPYAMASGGSTVNLGNSATTTPMASTNPTAAYSSGIGVSSTDPFGTGMNTTTPTVL